MIRIMVVDDHELVRIGLRYILADYPAIHIAAEAGDGETARRLKREIKPDVITLDVEMPRMDGYELAEYVRADARLRHIPIIMITSRAGRKHRKRGMKAGANVYLSKPYKESDLLSEVTQLLDKGKQ